MNKNFEFIDRVKLLIEYDMSMTLSENVKIVSEQSTYVNPEVIKRGGYTVPSDATSVADPRTRQLKSVSKTDIGFSDEIKDIMDHHTILPILSMGSLLIPYVGPMLSIGFDLLDSYFYYSEGDQFMFGLTLCLSVIPANDLLKLLSRRYKVTYDGLKSLISKIIKKVSKFTEEEILLLKEIGKRSNEIVKLAEKYLQRVLWKQMFKKISLKNIVRYLYVWSKRNPNKSEIFKFVFKFGSITVTYEQLAKIYGIVPKKEDEVLPDKVEIEKNYQINKEEINNQIIDSLIPFSDEEINTAMDNFLKTVK